MAYDPMPDYKLKLIKRQVMRKVKASQFYLTGIIGNSMKIKTPVTNRGLNLFTWVILVFLLADGQPLLSVRQSVFAVPAFL
jgi:hypothetical protein